MVLRRLLALSRRTELRHLTFVSVSLDIRSSKGARYVPISSTCAALGCGRYRWLFASSVATYVRRLILLGNGVIACRGACRRSLLCQETLCITIEESGVRRSKICLVSSCLQTASLGSIRCCPSAWPSSPPNVRIRRIDRYTNVARCR